MAPAPYVPVGPVRPPSCWTPTTSDMRRVARRRYQLFEAISGIESGMVYGISSRHAGFLHGPHRRERESSRTVLPEPRPRVGHPGILAHRSATVARPSKVVDPGCLCDHSCRCPGGAPSPLAAYSRARVSGAVASLSWRRRPWLFGLHSSTSAPSPRRAHGAPGLAQAVEKRQGPDWQHRQPPPRPTAPPLAPGPTERPAYAHPRRCPRTQVDRRAPDARPATVSRPTPMAPSVARRRCRRSGAASIALDVRRAQVVELAIDTRQPRT